MRLRLVAVLILGIAAVVHPAQAAPGDVGGTIVAGPGAVTAGYATSVAVEPQGTPVTFYNGDQLSHTVTSVDRDAEGLPLFDVSAGGGGTATVKGAERLRAGAYRFFCSFHPQMTGTLQVQGGSGGVAGSSPRFTQRLRIPREVKGANIVLEAKQSDVQILAGKPATSMLTYGGTWPGPTLRRTVGQSTNVTVVNHLPSATGATSLHLHGGHQASEHDGRPADHLVEPGRSKKYVYPFREEGAPTRAMFSFYHDHRMDLTGRNNWYGLQGMVITDDPAERKLGLPTGAYDLPLLVADRSFDSSAQLTNPFPKSTDPKGATSGINGPYAPPGDATTGAFTLVNGQFRPYAAVATHRYRLRIVNASPFTSYDFRFNDGRPMVQVGNGNVLTKPVTRYDLLLGPAERADVVVDFGKDLGKNLILESVARTDTRPGAIGTPTTPVMQFRVGKRVADLSRVPVSLVPLPKLAVPSTPTKEWVFALGADAAGKTAWTINGQPFDHMRVDARIELGSVQRWTLTNASTLTHYIHVHEESWRTLTRNGLPPPAWEAGLQDTWRLDPGDTVEVAAKITDFLGPFLLHCHMLDHEDHGMMATFEVVKPGSLLAGNAHPGHPVASPSPRRSALRAATPRSGATLSEITEAALCRREEKL